eukprot:891008-Pelagomonas_calceolata.AAC.2
MPRPFIGFYFKNAEEPPPTPPVQMADCALGLTDDCLPAMVGDDISGLSRAAAWYYYGGVNVAAVASTHLHASTQHEDTWAPEITEETAIENESTDWHVFARNSSQRPQSTVRTARDKATLRPEGMLRKDPVVGEDVGMVCGIHN